MQWRNTGIVMVGPFGDWLNFPYDSSVHLIAEPDCCRIVTAEGCEILQRVLPSTVAIRSVGSTDPAALMFDAMEAFEEGDPNRTKISGLLLPRTSSSTPSRPVYWLLQASLTWPTSKPF